MIKRNHKLKQSLSADACVGS